MTPTEHDPSDDYSQVVDSDIVKGAPHWHVRLDGDPHLTGEELERLEVDLALTTWEGK